MASDTSIVGRYPRIRCARGSLSNAEVNAGKIIVKAQSGRTLTVVGGWMRAIGGNAATTTSVDVKDTKSTPVVAVACTVAGLTQNTILRFGTATTAEFNTATIGLTKNKGLQIVKTGAGDLGAGTSSVDYVVYYTVSS